MLIDEQFTKLPESIKDIAFKSEPGMIIYNSVLKVDDGKRPLDINRLKDFLDENSAEYLEMIDDKIIPNGREDIMFNDCISLIKKEFLKAQEDEIITKLSMADEDDNRDNIISLTQQLIEIQKELKE